jgi:hypothetical protein
MIKIHPQQISGVSSISLNTAVLYWQMAMKLSSCEGKSFAGDTIHHMITTLPTKTHPKLYNAYIDSIDMIDN